MKRKNLILLLATITIFSTLIVGCGKQNITNTENENNLVVENTETTEIETEISSTEIETEISSTEVENNIENNETTVGNLFRNAFVNSSNTDSMSIAEELCNNGLTEISLCTAKIEPGYLAGFDTEISNFNNCTQFAPMIGSIPFVGYIFETDDVEGLVTELKENANLRWNICTEADEQIIETKNNLVFFIMCSNN